MRRERISSPKQIDPMLVARTIDEGTATEHVALLDVLFELMESKLYPGKDELNVEHTEVAWMLEDGGLYGLADSVRIVVVSRLGRMVRPIR